MNDRFVDDLFEKLTNERQAAQTRADRARESRERIAVTAGVWWDDFCRVLERKVQAWNKKAEPVGQVRFTRTTSGSVSVWHQSAEAELRLSEPRVVMTGRIGDTQPRESPFIEFNEVGGDVVAALASDSRIKSAIDAANHILAPILVHAFNASGSMLT